MTTKSDAAAETSAKLKVANDEGFARWRDNPLVAMVATTSLPNDATREHLMRSAYDAGFTYGCLAAMQEVMEKAIADLK